MTALWSLQLLSYAKINRAAINDYFVCVCACLFLGQYWQLQLAKYCCLVAVVGSFRFDGM